jgi:DNA end-binding protein Ku
VYYANEVRAYDDIELGPDQRFSDAEQQLAERLIEQLSVDAFAADKYHDEYAERVRKAAEEKAAGQQITLAPEQPAAQIIDLFEALKQSLNQGAKPPAAEAAKPGKAAKAKAEAEAQDDDDAELKGVKKAPGSQKRKRQTG